MKKIFLSLSAIALLAVGTVSCGGDDSSTPPVITDDTPGPGDDTTPGEVTKGFSVGGEVYLLDNLESQVTSNADATAIQILDVELSDESVVRATRWLMVAYSGNDPMTSLNYHQSTIFIPVGEGDAIITPAAAESFIVGGFGVYANNASTPLNLGAISQISLGFQTYVDGTENSLGSIAYSSQFTSANEGVIQMVFQGDMDGTYLVPAPTAPTSIQAKSSTANKVKNSDISKFDTYYGGKVTLENGKVIKRN